MFSLPDFFIAVLSFYKVMHQVLVFHPPSCGHSSVYLLCSLSFFVLQHKFIIRVCVIQYQNGLLL